MAGESSTPSTIPQLLSEAARRYGDRPAIEDGDVTLSFQQLEDAGSRAARAFCAAGVEAGDRVAIWAPNIWEWIVAAVGVHCAGAILAPVSTRAKGAEVGYMLRKSRAKVLLTVNGFLDTDYPAMLANEELPNLTSTVMLRGESPGAVSWSDFLEAGDAFPEDQARTRADAVGPEDISDILFTSGTTGNPKGVMAAHGQSLRVFEVWSDVVGLREGDRYLVVMPFFHTFGYKAGWLSALMRGATVLPCAVFELPAILHFIQDQKVSVFPGAPTIYQTILARDDLGQYDLSSLRLAVTGAAAVPVEMVHRMRDELGFDTIVTAYGLTESTGMVSICRPGDDAETISTTSGCAIPGVEVKCIDPDGKEVPSGEPGEVLVRGYNVMQGYFEDEEETAKAVDSEGWLHTGDIALMDERGYLRITDRIKDMYIAGGFNCYPAEIESLMFGSGLFAQVAVIGIPDERLGEVGMAFVVPAANVEQTPESVIAWCRESMSNYKVPRRVEIVDELPLNASGKVMKFVLRERALASR
jgi:acyl-CoA synthetase (AMP-forming)/AMP-acid ligase II